MSGVDGDGHGSIQWFDASFKWKKRQPALIQIYPIAIALWQSYVIFYYKIGWLRVSLRDFFCFGVLLNLLFFLRFLFLFRILKIDYPMTKYALTLARGALRRRAHSMIKKDIRQPGIVFFSIDIFLFINRERSLFCWSDLFLRIEKWINHLGCNTMHISSRC